MVPAYRRDRRSNLACTAQVALKDIARESPLAVCGSAKVGVPKCQAMARASRLQTWYMLRRHESGVAENNYAVAYGAIGQVVNRLEHGSHQVHKLE